MSAVRHEYHAHERAWDTGAATEEAKTQSGVKLNSDLGSRLSLLNQRVLLFHHHCKPRTPSLRCSGFIVFLSAALRS